MKFEKISDKTFQMFKANQVKNMNAIIGGAVDTSGGGKGWHDTAYTGTVDLDEVRKTADGQSDDSKGELI
jgi:hypothetical protein